MEEILQAVEKNQEKLPERQKTGKVEIKNQAKEDREAKLKEEKLLQKQKEDMRKNRHTKLL